jgi:hypothetical protein
MSEYFVVYGLLWGGILLGVDGSSKHLKLLFLALYVLLFTAFWGLRWNCGTDWDTFHQAYIDARWGNIFSYIRYGEEKMEYGYMLLNVLVKRMGFGYTGFLILSNFFVISVYAWFLYRNTDNPIFSLAALLSSQLVFPVRQTLAAAILLISHDYAIRGRNKHAVLVALIASSIHISALAAIPLLFLLKFRVNWKIANISYWGTYLSSGFLVVFVSFMNYIPYIGGIFATKLQGYIGVLHSMGDEFGVRSIQGIVLNGAFIFAFYWAAKERKSATTTYFLNGFLFSAVVGNVFLVIMRDLARIGEYSAYFFGPLMGSLLLRFTSGGSLLRFGATSVAIVYFAYRLNNSIQTFPELLIPYRHIF